jgi:enamine deaminase RidA (YjgF/YER057c/UK114 family)
MQVTPEARLRELGIELPEQLPVIGSYRLAKRHRDLVYIAGHVSLRLDHTNLIRGKVGQDVTLEQAHEAARVCALHMLSTLRIEIGSLDRVASIIKVIGMVNVSRGFVQLATVMDGCTDQLIDVFGEDAGTPARVAVGMAELPLGAAVETEMVVALTQGRLHD